MSREKHDLHGLPTRTGTPTGHANERQMLEKIRDNLGFETSARVRLDGSYTLLRTKGGMPRFITDPVPPAVASIIARGFLARATAKPFGAIFDPYDLDIEVKQYKPASITYYVGKVQAAAYEPRKWRDVWSWDGSLLRINGVQAKTFYPIKFPADVKGAIPYIIPWPSAPIYGTKETNSPFPKRVFAVGPEAVGIAISPAYGGASIAAVKLSPETPRSNRKALVCGAAIDPAAHEATLSQLYFTGALWDSLTGGWAYSTTKVAMLLTVPFLQATHESAGVDMPVPSFGEAVSSSGTGSESTTLPSTEIGLIGAGRVALAVPYEAVGSSGQYTVVYDWTGTQSRSLDGKIDFSYSRTQRQGSESATEIQAGVTLTYAGANEKHWDSRYETTHVKAQTVTVADHDQNGGSNYSGSNMTGDSDHLYWGQYYTYLNPPGGPLNTGDIASTRGRTTYVVQYNEYIPGSGATRNYENQSGSFTVSTVTGSLIDLTFSRSRSFGDKAIIVPYTGYYAGTLANPIYDGPGFGSYNGPVYFSAYSDPATDITWIQNYKSYWDGSKWTQDASTVNEINTKYREMADRFAAMTLYDNENSQGVWSRDHYTAYVANNVTLDDKTLTWETHDYILCDELNSTLIFVEGHFSATKSGAEPASATLTALLTVETPHGSVSKTLYSMTYTYGNMLPEVEIYPGTYAIPSPQIRAIFAPAFREQGAFRGAAYVTADEESNGAAPAIVVNFVLALETYAFIGEDEPTDKVVHFVPCNLLEMLYAFVYSREYGIHPAYRYPVTDTSAYNAIMAGLFGVQHPLHYRDGAFADWMAGLGNPYYADKKTELSRV